jgi:hypothetical protein
MSSAQREKSIIDAEIAAHSSETIPLPPHHVSFPHDLPILQYRPVSLSHVFAFSSRRIRPFLPPSIPSFLYCIRRFRVWRGRLQQSLTRSTTSCSTCSQRQ